MGMAGRGWMSHDLCPWDALAYNASGQLLEPLNETQIQALAEDFIAGNPRLKVGKISKKDGEYIVEIVTRKGNALVDRIAIDETTGAMRPVE